MNTNKIIQDLFQKYSLVNVQEIVLKNDKGFSLKKLVVFTYPDFYLWS